MQITLFNFSEIPDDYVQAAVRAINRQIAEDFQPHWGYGARVRLENATPWKPRDMDDLEKGLAPLELYLRGDAVVFLFDSAPKPAAEVITGQHFPAPQQRIPWGLVAVDTARRAAEGSSIPHEEFWTVSLSHEILELIADPSLTTFIQGPRPEGLQGEALGKGHQPEDIGSTVFFRFEVCDPVQLDTYEIDGVRVSNFVLPGYFAIVENRARRTDFLGPKPEKGGGRKPRGDLQSFTVAPGGVLPYLDGRLSNAKSESSDEKHWFVIGGDNEVDPPGGQARARSRGQSDAHSADGYQVRTSLAIEDGEWSRYNRVRLRTSVDLQKARAIGRNLGGVQEPSKEMAEVRLAEALLAEARLAEARLAGARL